MKWTISWNIKYLITEIFIFFIASQLHNSFTYLVLLARKIRPIIQWKSVLDMQEQWPWILAKIKINITYYLAKVAINKTHAIWYGCQSKKRQPCVAAVICWASLASSTQSSGLMMHTSRSMLDSWVATFEEVYETCFPQPWFHAYHLGGGHSSIQPSYWLTLSPLGRLHRTWAYAGKMRLEGCYSPRHSHCSQLRSYKVQQTHGLHSMRTTRRVACRRGHLVDDKLREEGFASWKAIHT